MINLLKKLFGAGRPQLSPELLQRATIIDVRTPQEYRQGHAENTINIPLQDLDRSLSRIKKYKTPIVTCCRSGARSGTAVRKLKEAGLEAYNGGSWQDVQRRQTEGG